MATPVLTIDVNNQTPYILGKRLRMTRNSLDVTLVDPVSSPLPAPGMALTLTNPTWSGTVTSVTKTDQDKAGHLWVSITATNESELVLTAGGSLSDATDDYRNLVVSDVLHDGVTESRGSLETFEAGHLPGHTFELTSSTHGYVAQEWTIQEVDVSWLRHDTPLYTIQFGEPMVTLSAWIQDEQTGIFPITETQITDGAVTTPKVAANAITSTHIDAGSITAEKLAAELILASLIKTSEDGNRVELDDEGFRSFNSAEEVLVNIPTDDSPVYINAQVEALSLTVTGDAVLQGDGNTVAAGGALTLDTYQQDPTQPPTLTSTWDTITFPIDLDVDIDEFAYDRVGLHFDDAGGAGGATDVFWTTSEGLFAGNYYLVELLASDRTVNRSKRLVAPYTITATHGVARIGANVYVLVQTYNYHLDKQTFYILRYTETTLALNATYGPVNGVINQVNTIPEWTLGAGQDFTIGAYAEDTTFYGWTAPFVHGTNMTSAAMQTALRSLTGDTGLTVSGTTNVGPFVITWSDGYAHHVIWNAYELQGTTDAEDTINGGWRRPALASNGTSLFIVDKPVGTGTIKWKTYNSSGTETAEVNTSYNSGTDEEVMSAYAGNADIGAARVFVAMSDKAIHSFNSSGTRQADEQFSSRSEGAGGLTYGDALGDGARFWSFPGVAGSSTASPPTTMTKHSTWTWTTASSVYWVGYSWYDSNATGGTHETEVGPMASIQMGRRKKLRVTTAAIPGAGGTDEPNNVRIYIFPNASQPAASSLDRQATTSSTSSYITDYDSAGSAPSGSNTFSSLSDPAQLISGSLVIADGVITMAGRESWVPARIEGFIYENVAIGLASTAMGRFIPTQTAIWQTRAIAGRAGRAIGVGWRISAAISAGTITLRGSIAGVAQTGADAVLDNASGLSGYIAFATPFDFTATSGLHVLIEANGSLDTNTKDVSADIIIEYEPLA